MLRFLWVVPVVVVLSVGCASKSKKGETTAEALQDLEKRYSEKVGTSQKSELVEEFGSPAWCEPKPGGAESCRFYRSMGRQWRGDKDNRTSYEAFDEVIADFDPQGRLRTYKARAQR
jgi:hypothetical protein